MTLAQSHSTPGAELVNTAQVSFLSGGGKSAVVSNTVSTLVGQILDLTVTAALPSHVSVRQSDSSRAVGFVITNSGTGREGLTLSADLASPERGFSPVFRQIVLDSNSDGQLEATDAVYQASGSALVLAPGQAITAWIVADMPASLAAGSSAPATLTATVVAGAGAPGTSFPGAGVNGATAVVGKTGAKASAQALYLASTLAVQVLKSQSVNVAHATAGALVTYTLTAQFSGTGVAAGASLADAIPPGVTYAPGTLRLDGAPLTDAADGDAGRIDSNGLTVALGDVAAPAAHTVSFQARINPPGGSQ